MMLRDYQQKLLDDISAAFKSGKRSVLAQSATGSGKTHVAITAAKLAADRGKRVLFQAHTRPLVDQTIRKFEEAGVEVGVMMAGRSGNGLPIQVGSVQTIMRRLEKTKPFNLIITDETRRATSKTYKTIFAAWPDAYHIGLDATPCRADGKGLGSIYETMVHGPSVQALIDAGHLAPFQVYSHSLIDTSNLHMRGGDFAQDEAEALVDTAVITGDCVSHYLRIAPDRQALTYCASIKHAMHVHEAFTSGGVCSAILHSELTPGEQTDAIRRVRDGSVRNLISVGMVNDGFDVPNVSCAILLRPTASLSLCLQQMGRSNRGGGGPTAIILDHVGNVLRHGLPETDRVWTLDGQAKTTKKKTEDTIAIRHCKECFMVYRAGLPSCPHCGADAKTTARLIEEREGTLVEITKEMQLALMPYSDAVSQCETAADIRALAKARGYKPYWAIKRVSEKFAVNYYKAASMLGYNPGVVKFLRTGTGG